MIHLWQEAVFFQSELSLQHDTDLCIIGPLNYLPFSSPGGIFARIGAATLHKVIALATQRLQLHVSDVTVRYNQRGVPGPRFPLAGRLCGEDSAQLTIRGIQLQPSGTTPLQHGLLTCGYWYHSPTRVSRDDTGMFIVM